MSGENLLRFVGVGNMLDREYRNLPAFQWARELVRNGVEANAKNIELGVEWQGVASQGVYRRLYADDGAGMSRDDLRTYMQTLGKGSKLVGGPHDNYALGCRMALLPWNPEGVVVISLCEGDLNMVRMQFDPEAGDEGEYVLEEIDWVGEDGREHQRDIVYPPYPDPSLGLDWKDCVPQFVNQAGHGTVFVLLGRKLADDTFEGDTDRGESARDLTRRFFNSRFWGLPDGVTLRCADFVKPLDHAEWPRLPSDSKAYQMRAIKGAHELVEYRTRDGESTIESSGILPFDDGTRIHWWLRKPGVDTGGIGTSSGFIATLYRDELYGHAYASKDDGETAGGANVYRQFGIGSDSVRRRVFLVVEPPEFNEESGSPGIAPSTGRADLYWIGAGISARAVKPADWAEAFAENMPPEIEAALAAAHSESRGDSGEREERLRRIMDRFAKRWKTPRARLAQNSGADTTTSAGLRGAAARERADVPKPPRRKRARKRVVIKGASASNAVGAAGTPGAPAKSARVELGYPSCEYVTARDIDDEGMLAAWQGPSRAHENGLIQIDETHPVITSQIEFHQNEYPKALWPEIKQIVKDAYEEVAIAKVCHLHSLTGPVLSESQRDAMLENPALTAALVGLLSEDALIKPRLGGMGAKKRRKAGLDPDELSDSAEDPAS